MMKVRNDRLKIHIISVGHGDSILIEMPDLKGKNGQNDKASIGLVDAGGFDDRAESKTLEYIRSLLTYRDCFDEVAFHFICLTHPHKDHLLGMLPILNHCADQANGLPLPNEFWDCGFRFNTLGYLSILDFLTKHTEVQFARITSGTEFHFDDVEILVLAPSIDMRNRYDTYGVELNNASIVLKITYGDSTVILTGDSEFDTWGKICEEFPRTKKMVYPDPATLGTRAGKLIQKNPEITALLSESSPLKCTLLKMAHHGSKNGTNYECLKKLAPRHMIITCDNAKWYRKHQSSWKNSFPHPITRLIIAEHKKKKGAPAPTIPDEQFLKKKNVLTTGHEDGSVVYSFNKNEKVARKSLKEGCLGPAPDFSANNGFGLYP